MSEMSLRNALAALVNKLDDINNHPSYSQVFTVSALHGLPYEGPSYEKELEDARRILSED